MALGSPPNGNPPKELHLGDLKIALNTIYDAILALGITPDDARDLANMVRYKVRRKHQFSQEQFGPEAFQWGKDPTPRRERNHHRIVETVLVNKDNEGSF